MNRVRLAYRRLNQRIRRWFFSFDTPWRRRLYDRKRVLVASKSFSLVFVPLTPEMQDQLEAINWTLGNGYLYDKMSPEEQAWQKRVADRIMEKLRREQGER